MSRQRSAVAEDDGMELSSDDEDEEDENDENDVETDDSAEKEENNEADVLPVDIDYTRATTKAVRKSDGTKVMFQELCLADRNKFKRGKWYVVVRFEDGFEVVSKAWLVSQAGDKWQCFFPHGAGKNPLRWIEAHPQPFTNTEGVKLYNLVEKAKPQDYFECKFVLLLFAIYSVNLWWTGHL